MRPPLTASRQPRGSFAVASITLLYLLPLCLGPASASASSAPSLFKRWTQTFALGLGGSTATTTASSTSTASGANTPTQTKTEEFVDSWATQPNLRVVSQMMEGDRFGVLSNMVQNKGLEEIWSKPWAFHRMLQTFPMLEGIKGFPELMAKDAEDLTPEDGLSALQTLRQAVGIYVSKMAEMADPVKLTALFQNFSERKTEDPVVQQLHRRMQEGDEEASYELQQLVADEAWGGLIDLKAFGVDGIMPKQLTAMRDIIKDKDPAVWELVHQNDPIMERILTDPMAAKKMVQETMDSLREAEATNA